MNKKILAIGFAGTMATSLLAGCVSDPYAPPGYGQKTSMGTLGGAVAGGLIGSTIGHGSGRVAAIAGGALIGGFIGNQIGAQLDAQDRAYYYNAQMAALNSGTPANWSNPQNGRYGSVQVGSYYTVNNAACRQYTSTIYIDGQPQVSRGTACRGPDGTWSPVSG